MLVLSRQKDESIIIGDDVEITIVDVRGDKVRLGINAPREISVHRKEVYEAIQREKAEKARAEQASSEGPASEPRSSEQEAHDQFKSPAANNSRNRRSSGRTKAEDVAENQP